MRFDVLLTTVRMRLCLLTNGRQDENPHAEQMRLEWKEGCYVRVVGQVKLQGLAVFLKIKTVFTVSKGTILPQGLLYIRLFGHAIWFRYCVFDHPLPKYDMTRYKESDSPCALQVRNNNKEKFSVVAFHIRLIKDFNEVSPPSEPSPDFAPPPLHALHDCFFPPSFICQP